jgi:hypothetical protein
MLTLAKKLETVHKTTVTIKHARPSVLRATFQYPAFFRLMLLSLLRDMKEAVKSSVSSNDDNLLCSAGSGAMSTGKTGSDGAMTGSLISLASS